jgi:hypothetical protein
MERRQIWVVEKIHGVAYRRAACSRCGWVSEMPFYRGAKRGGTPGNTTAIQREFQSHDCSEFSGGSRRWRVKPT